MYGWLAYLETKNDSNTYLGRGPGVNGEADTVEWVLILLITQYSETTFCGTHVKLLALAILMSTYTVYVISDI